MEILAFILLIAGAIVGYGARPILEKVLKRDATDKEVGIWKSVGLITAFVGAIIIFIIKK